VHECEVEVALSGQRVAAVGHRYLLHCNFKSGGRERLDKDVCRTAYSFQRGGSLRCDRVDERQSCLVRAEQGANDATAVAPDNRDRGEGQRYGADGDGYSIYLKDPEGTVVELKSGN
jgi:hypothetical protein